MNSFNKSRKSKYVEKIDVGIGQAPASFGLLTRLKGVNEANFKYMIKATGADVTLRGFGSGYNEAGTSSELQEPLHIRIEHENMDRLQDACEHAVSLVKTVIEDYLKFCPQLVKSPHQSPIGSTTKNVVKTGIAPTPLSHSTRPEGHSRLSKDIASQRRQEETYYKPQMIEDGSKLKQFQKKSPEDIICLSSDDELIEDDKLFLDSIQPSNTSKVPVQTQIGGNGRDSMQTESTTSPQMQSGQPSMTELLQQLRQEVRTQTQQQNQPTTYSKEQSLIQLDSIQPPSPVSEFTQKPPQQLPPLQYLPEQKPYVPQWTLDPESDVGTAEETMISPIGATTASRLFEEEEVPCKDKKVLITSVPKNGESLYTACTHLLFGPFNSLSELIAVASSLHKRVVNYIRKNEDTYFKQLVNLYDKCFPNHGLNSYLAFEHCCLYLSKPGHLGIELTLNAIASIFAIPIVILNESDGKHDLIKPPYNTDATPIVIFSRMKPNNHFDPVVNPSKTSVPNEFLQLNVWNSLYSHHHNIIVATWYYGLLFNSESILNRMDSVFASKNVTLACIQGTCAQKCLGQRDETKNYIWWYVAEATFRSNQCVAFGLNKHFPGFLSKFCALSGNLVSAVFSVNNTEITLIGCHLLDSRDEYSKICPVKLSYDTVSSELTKLVKQTKSDLLLLGNFNALFGFQGVESNQENLTGINQPTKSIQNEVFLKTLASANSLKLVTLCLPIISHLNPQIKNQPTLEEQQSHILVRSNNTEIVEHFGWWETDIRNPIIASKLNL